MPMQWSRGRNPYAFNHLAVLGLGAGLTRPMIAQQRQNLTQRLAAGQSVEVAGQPIDQAIVGEAARQLHLAAALAEELLLAHPHHPPQATASADDLAQLKKWIGLTATPEMPALRGPQSLFWLLPAPGAEAAELPPWEAFGLPGPCDPADLALDVVFDG